MYIYTITRNPQGRTCRKLQHTTVDSIRHHLGENQWFARQQLITSESIKHLKQKVTKHRPLGLKKNTTQPPLRYHKHINGHKSPTSHVQSEERVTLEMEIDGTYETRWIRQYNKLNPYSAANLNYEETAPTTNRVV